MKAILNLLIGVSSTAHALQCPFGYGADGKKHILAQTDGPTIPSLEEVGPAMYSEFPWFIANNGNWTAIIDSIEYPTDMFQCPANPEALYRTKKNFNVEDYKYVVNTIIDRYDQLTAFGTSQFLAARMTGCMVRVAGHDFMDYRRNMDGSE